MKQLVQLQENLDSFEQAGIAVVAMTYGSDARPSFRLFIDRDTHRLRGFAAGAALHTIRKYSEPLQSATPK